MKTKTIQLISALFLSTALAGCLSTGGGTTQTPTTGGGSGSGGSGSGGSGSGSGGSGSGSGGGTGGGSTGGGTGSGTGGFDQAAFDENYDRVMAMTNTPAAPASISANYKGAFSMRALDPEATLSRVLFVQGDLDLDLDYNPASAGDAQTNVWSGGATNLTGKAVVGMDETQIAVEGEMAVGQQGNGYNNSLAYAYPLLRYNAFLDGSGMTIEGKPVDGIVALSGDFKGDNMEAASGGIIGNVDIGSGNTNFTGTAYLERQ